MVLEAGDHQQMQEDIDFMLINGLIIILHQLLISFLCFHWKVMTETFGKNTEFMKKHKNYEKNTKFKILQLQPWDLAQKIGLDLRIPDHTLTSLCDH